jgi:hypothetical protein
MLFMYLHYILPGKREDMEERFTGKKSVTPKDVGPDPLTYNLFLIILFCVCVFLSVLYYGVFNFDSIP